jgi:hypothetical protein
VSIPEERRQLRQSPRPTRDADPQFVQFPVSFGRGKETEPADDVMKGNAIIVRVSTVANSKFTNC